MTLLSFCDRHEDVTFERNYNGKIELRLSTNLAKEPMQELCSEILANNSVETLSVGNFDFTEDKFHIICELLANPKCTVKELMFTSQPFYMPETYVYFFNQNIAGILSKLLCNPNNNIEYLKFDSIIPENEMHNVLEIIGKGIINDNSKIKKLSLWRNQFTDTAIQTIARTLGAKKSKLEMLDIQMSRHITQGETLDHIGRVMTTQPLKELHICEDITYDDNKSTQFFLSLSDPKCALETLSFYYIAISDSAMDLLAKHVAKPSCHLKHLELPHCQVSETAINGLLQSLNSGSATLESLDLGYITLTDHTCQMLAKVISSDNFTVKKMNLAGCKITKENILLLSKSLLANKHLEEIIFWDNCLNLEDTRNNHDSDVKQALLDTLQNLPSIIKRKALPLKIHCINFVEHPGHLHAIENIDSAIAKVQQVRESAQAWLTFATATQNLLLESNTAKSHLSTANKVLMDDLIRQEIFNYFIAKDARYKEDYMKQSMIPMAAELQSKRASGHPGLAERFLPLAIFNAFREKANNEPKSEAGKVYQNMAIVPYVKMK